MLTVEHKQEQLSKSYIIATAAAARVNLDISREHDYGVDGTFLAVSERETGELLKDGTPQRRFVENGIKIDFQLKCSSNWEENGDHIAWSIENKTYNDCVTRHPSSVPLILILMCVPSRREEWVLTSEEHLVLKRCCYFHQLFGPVVKNESSKKLIKIPRCNLLTPSAVTQLLLTEERNKAELFP